MFAGSTGSEQADMQQGLFGHEVAEVGLMDVIHRKFIMRDACRAHDRGFHDRDLFGRSTGVNIRGRVIARNKEMKGSFGTKLISGVNSKNKQMSNKLSRSESSKT